MSLDNDIKVSVLLGGVQNTKARDHLELNVGRLTSYASVRSEILDFRRGK